MASPYEVEVKLLSAKNLKNVNWRYGPNLPYAVVWVDPAQKRSTNVDKSGDTQPNWNEQLITPMPPSTPINNCIVFIDVLHLESNNKAPLIIGSTQLPLDGIKIDDLSGVNRTLKLKRPSGRPQGTVDVKVIIKNLAYHAPYGAPHPYGSPYGAPPVPGASLSVTYGNPYNVAPPPPAGYGYPVASPTYAAASRPPVGYPASAPYAYGQSIQQGTQQGESEKSSQFGLGTGLAVGAGAGLAVGVVVGGVGALALGKDKEAHKEDSYHVHEVESEAYYEHVEEASHVEEANVDHVEEASHVEEANVYYEEYTSHVEEASSVEEANAYYEEYAPEVEEESYVEEANAYYEEY